MVSSSVFLRIKDYGLAVVCVGVAATIRLVLDPLLGSSSLLLLFAVAVIAANVGGGEGPGLLATFLSVLAAWYFSLDPRYSFPPPPKSDISSLVLLAASGIGISLFAKRIPLSHTVRPAHAGFAFLRGTTEAARTTDAQFHTLADAIPQLCWMADAEGFIVWYNQRWYDYTGSAPADMRGWGWQSVHDPQVLPKVLDRWKACILSGEPFEMVFPLRGADGVFRPFLTRVMPVRNDKGQVTRWFGTNTEITEQQKTETALRQALEQQELAFEAAALGTWDYNLETGEVLWDEPSYQMFGFRPGEPIFFETVLARVHEEDRQSGFAALEQAVTPDGSGKFHYEFRILQADGTIRWLAAHARVHRNPHGGRENQVHLIGVNMDITQSKESELRIRQVNAKLETRVLERTTSLQAANKELEAFAYSVSHDLRAPLRGIDGWTLALLEDCASQLDPRGTEYLNRVRSETQRMGMLIDDLLQLSRISRAAMETNDVDLSGLAGGVAARLRDAYNDRIIQFSIPPGLKTVADTRLLEVVLVNLFSNAVKFTKTRSNARIELGQMNRDGQPVFFVRDNGVGFDMAYAGNLFGAFQRLHKASEFPGTGVGLATVQRIIHRHGGRIWAEAQPDRGATFFFTLGMDSTLPVADNAKLA